jgi:predicted double-glycine peptidase
MPTFLMMSALFETVVVTGLAGIGFLLGRWFSGLKKWWWVGFAIPFALLVMIGSTRRYSGFEFVPPTAWLVQGRMEFALAGLITTMVLTTPVMRLPKASTRRFVYVFMGFVVVATSVWPFLAPVVNRGALMAMKTQFDQDGVCRQNTVYTCGPAAAVTALRQLGFAAEEGELAILAHTSTAIGTPPDLLAAALQKRYAAEGLDCEYRHFRGVEELKEVGVVLAVTKFALFVDHYVTVLEVTASEVRVADPFYGKRTYSRDAFREQWRFCGIVLRRGE